MFMLRFVCQSRLIKVTNLDGKVQTDKETRKHVGMLPASIRAVVCEPSNCGRQDERTDTPVEKFARMIRKRVRVFEIVTTIEISIPGEFVSIDRNDYFTFSNNSDVIPPSEALPNSLFLMTWHITSRTR